MAPLPRGDHRNVPPSAETAIEPSPVLPAGAVRNGLQVVPPSREYAPRSPGDDPAPDSVPTRAMMAGAPAAKSRLRVLPKVGLANMPAGGETSRSSCRNPA